MAHRCFHAQHCAGRVPPSPVSCRFRSPVPLALPSWQPGIHPNHRPNLSQQSFRPPSNLQSPSDCRMTTPWLQPPELTRVLLPYIQMLPQPRVHHHARTISRLMLLSRTSVVPLARYFQTSQPPSTYSIFRSPQTPNTRTYAQANMR